MTMDGTHDVPLLALNLLPAGADLGSSMLVPPGGNVFFVRGNGTTVTGYDYDPPGLADRLIASVAKALTYCVASRGDLIMVLEGHTENLGAAAWPLVAGVKIRGRGTGINRPTFTFTAAGSTVLLSKANVVIENCRFLCAGPAGTTALSVAAPFTCSAAGNYLARNYFQVGIDADQLATAFFTTTAAGDDLTIIGNEVDGAANSAMTTCFNFVGADRLKFVYNTVRGGLATDTDGLLAFTTTASTDVLIASNLLHARSTGNTVCIQMAANLVNTGWIVNNFCRNVVDASVAWIITTGTGVNVQLQGNFGINNANEAGLAIGTASACTRARGR